ncbi:MAG: dicarboxylate/amino acid:cation symporter [Chlamydiia bacterium]|nr:dicarboxylate/amino acid:cation symporter [Chlamydiia bacterium]
MSEPSHSCQSPVPTFYLLLAVLLGVMTGVGGHYIDLSVLNAVASGISQVFIKLLKLVSLPIIFLSIVSTATGMENLETLKSIGGRIFKYTLITTLISATLAFVIFLLFDPVSAYTYAQTPALQAVGSVPISHPSYSEQLIKLIPSNIVEPFLDNNVIGILLIAMGIGLSTLTLDSEKRRGLNQIFSSLYAVVMKVTTTIIRFMPIAIWAFVTMFFQDLANLNQFHSLALYLAAVLTANLVQGFVVLPLFLKLRGGAPLQIAKAMLPALSTAFFSKSSSGSIPVAIRCAEKNAGVDSSVAGFSLPLCTTINMNGCAAFIFITVLFVSMTHGMEFTIAQMFAWILISTIAAVGNAGVPMGCYFMSTAFLVAMDVPLDLMAVILPFYSLIDMLESAINVWSDSCVTVVVDRELKALDAQGVTSTVSASAEADLSIG